jgi:hypothetical protein
VGKDKVIHVTAFGDYETPKMGPKVHDGYISGFDGGVKIWLQAQYLEGYGYIKGGLTQLIMNNL